MASIPHPLNVTMVFNILNSLERLLYYANKTVQFIIVCIGKLHSQLTRVYVEWESLAGTYPVRGVGLCLLTEEGSLH